MLPEWLRDYERKLLSGDIVAGVIVAIMLVPQSMAYALIAGLPPEAGLYAAMLPLFIYPIFCSSTVLAIGPVAIVSLMVASSLSSIAAVGTPEYAQAALTLALLSGIILIGLGIARFDYFINYFSRPVIVGFINAATVLITVSQLSYLFGLAVPSELPVYGKIAYFAENWDSINLSTLMIGISAITTLLLWKKPLRYVLSLLKAPEALISVVTKTGALVIVIASIVIVREFNLAESAGVAIVGRIPDQLPELAFPDTSFELIQQLFPSALILSLIGYIESVSVAKMLASGKRSRVNPNKELIAIGASNIAASVTGAYPVAGGIGRSMVNFSAGANTPLASIITGILITLFVSQFASTLFYLPQSVLSAIVIIAVLSLFDMKIFLHTWRFNKLDASGFLVTFVSVLLWGAEYGILLGLAFSICSYLWRTGQLHMAIVGRYGDSDHYLDSAHHEVETDIKVLAIRIDDNLYFANAHSLENRILKEIAESRQLNDVILVFSTISFLDASAIDTLDTIRKQLAAAEISLHLCDIKDKVMKQLVLSGFIEALGVENIHMTPRAAMKRINVESDLLR